MRTFRGRDPYRLWRAGGSSREVHMEPGQQRGDKGYYTHCVKEDHGEEFRVCPCQMSPSQAKQLREGRGGEEGEGRTARQRGIPTFKRDHPHKQKQIPRIPTRCGEEIGFPSGAKNGVQPKAHAPHRTPALGDHLSGTQYSLAGGRERSAALLALASLRGQS